MRFLQKQKKAIIQIFQIATSYLFTAINHARNSPLPRAYSTSSSSRASSIWFCNSLRNEIMNDEYQCRRSCVHTDSKWSIGPRISREERGWLDWRFKNLGARCWSSLKSSLLLLGNIDYDPGTKPAKRVWISINVAEIHVSNRQETVEWTVSDFDVLVPQKQTRSL
ncbi:hypothetical protein ARALYDRAFT_327171 [Arabidopsis lyrata subsp. lyrata]|uniref:DUF7705 domain-containing protein n=1 Tax=Arabidopsis lyrata subsp. lyrata TaxID=81972 RepID=D7LXZ2_ARALL|nr:hypothetical protein ARALYDRAFT_327171 [Arabidopsis lyrata subsp. lyrata]